MKCKKADYIYVERIVGRKEQVRVKEESINDKHIVYIKQVMPESKKRMDESKCVDKQKHVLFLWNIGNEKWNKKKLQKDNERLLCVIKKFWSEKTMVVGNEVITNDWGMPNELFRIKKQILLQNVRDIVQQLGNKAEEKCSGNNRTCFLLVLDSDKWTYRDVKDLLWQAQEKYEDICVVSKRSLLDMEKLENFFIEECGVVLHQLTEEEARKKQFDTIFFLVEREGRWDKSYCFRNRYMISEWEENRFQTLLFVALNDTISSSIKRCD